MQMLCIADSQMEEFWGPYTNRPLAEKILKIVRTGVDEGAEIVSRECNEWENEISAGLLPWAITVLLKDGEVVDTSCKLTWPPEPQEGIIRGDMIIPTEEQVEYFVWAETVQSAKLKLVRLGTAALKVPRSAEA